MKKFKLFRYNESGDFHSQTCVDKLDYISKKLLGYQIITYGYSARCDLNFKHVSFLVKSSGYSNGNNGQTIVIDNIQDRPKGYKLCPGNCHTCNICIRPGNIAFLIHGAGRNKKEKIKTRNTQYRKYNGLEISLGNSKIPDTTFIFNMGSATNCPATVFCKCRKYCYALHAERQYKACLKYRNRQKRYWLKNDPDRIWNDLKIALNLK